MQGFIHLRYLTITFIDPPIQFVNHSWVVRVVLLFLQDEEFDLLDPFVDIVIQSLLYLIDVIFVVLLLDHSRLHDFVD